MTRQREKEFRLLGAAKVGMQIYGDTSGVRFVSTSPLNFFLLHGHNNSTREIYGRPGISEVLALSEIEESPGRLLSACVDSHLPLTENNHHTEVAYFGRAYSEPLQDATFYNMQ